MFFKIGVLKNFATLTGKHLCWSLFLIKLLYCCNFIKKETPIQVFSCEYCEIFGSSFFYRTPPVDASDYNSMVRITRIYLFHPSVASNIKNNSLSTAYNWLSRAKLISQVISSTLTEVFTEKKNVFVDI